MIKSGVSAAAAATGGRNEASSSSRSGKSSGKGKGIEGVKEREVIDTTGSYGSSERRHGTQMSTVDKPLRSSSGESVNVVSKLGRPPKNPGLFSNIEIESSPMNEGEGIEGFSVGSKFRKGSKRSRIGNDDLLSENEEVEIKKKYGLDELLQQLDNQIEDVYKKGERGRTNYNKLVTLDIFRKVNLEVIRRDAELINLKNKIIDEQEEKIAIAEANN